MPVNDKMSEEVKTCECSVKEMLQNEPVDPDFVADGIHFGRGDSYTCGYTKSTYKHNLEKTMVWKIVKNGLEAVSDDLIGQFDSDSSYIVYSKFRTKVLDASLQNKLEEFIQDNCFYWRGAVAPKGFSPLPPELEAKNPPVERIPQWSELPIFLRLFKGAMIVHNSKTDDKNNDDRLYILRGTVEEEIHFFEVPKEKRSLRSKTSFGLVRLKQKKILIWHGHKSDKRNGTFFKRFPEQISKYASKIYGNEINISDIIVEEINEQDQNEEFNSALDGSDEDYFSLVKETHTYKYNPKLFYFNSITGSFLATAVQDILFSRDFINPFPYLQEHLYSPAQPGNYYMLNKGYSIGNDSTHCEAAYSLRRVIYRVSH